jgi:hypothetical protein
MVLREMSIVFFEFLGRNPNIERQGCGSMGQVSGWGHKG